VGKYQKRRILFGPRPAQPQDIVDRQTHPISPTAGTLGCQYVVRTSVGGTYSTYKEVRTIKLRVDVKQAAEMLGISSEGVRQRIRRGNLESEKDDDGRVYVWIEEGESSSERNTHGVITRLENEVEWLRREVERKDTIIMSFTQKIPELEPVSEPRQSPVTASEHEAKGDVPPEPEKLSWWRKLFAS
jgi:hypothetical protein